MILTKIFIELSYYNVVIYYKSSAIDLEHWSALLVDTMQLWP